MNRGARKIRRGLTLAEVLIVALLTVLMVLIAVAVILPAFARTGSAPMLACTTRVNQIHKGLVLYSTDFGDRYPIPNDISPETAAVSAQTGNSSANFYSYMIWDTYYTPEVVTCPNDANPNVVVKTDYRYGTADDPNWNAAWKWDPSFSADITEPGANVSYATLVMLGDRRDEKWRFLNDPNLAVAGDRGPKDGVWDAKSLTLLQHGKASDWTGNVAFNDGSVRSMTFTKKDQSPFQINGDNLFFAEEGEMGGDMWLGLFGDTTEETTTPYWD